MGLKKGIVGILFFAAGAASAQTNSIGTSLYDWAKSWKASAFSVATMYEQDVLNRGGSRFSSDNQLTFKRAIAETNWKYGVGFPFIYSSTGYDRFNDERNNGQFQDQEFVMKDLFLEFSNSKLALLPGDIEVYGSSKIYFPTSEYSQNLGQVARIKGLAVLTKPVTTWFELKYFAEPSYYLQTRTAVRSTFKTESGSTVEFVELTKNYDIEQWAEAWIKLSSATGWGWKIRAEDTWYNTAKIEDRERERHLLSLGPIAKFQITDEIRFQLAYESEVDGEKNASDLGAFKAENSQLTLLTWIDI